VDALVAYKTTRAMPLAHRSQVLAATLKGMYDKISDEEAVATQVRA